MIWYVMNISTPIRFSPMICYFGKKNPSVLYLINLEIIWWMESFMWENPQILKLSTKNKLLGTEFVLRWNIQKCDFEISSMEKRNYVNFFCCSYFFHQLLFTFCWVCAKKTQFSYGKISYYIFAIWGVYEFERYFWHSQLCCTIEQPYNGSQNNSLRISKKFSNASFSPDLETGAFSRGERSEFPVSNICVSQRRIEKCSKIITGAQFNCFWL